MSGNGNSKPKVDQSTKKSSKRKVSNAEGGIRIEKTIENTEQTKDVVTKEVNNNNNSMEMNNKADYSYLLILYNLFLFL